MTAEPTPTPKVPLLGIVNLPESGKLDDLPESDWPYFVPTKTGMFLHKPVLYGTAFIPLKAWPESINMPENENPKGVVKLNNTRFPGYIVSQAVDFFTRIYDAHHTESAVVVTHNKETGGWRLFVPEQYVGHGGVQQRWDQEHLASGWYAVGTIHSHCDFGAFHSGTDVGDANDFDGMHITIGNLKHTEGPEFAQMLMINKVQIDLTIEQAINWDDMTGPKTAPLWWDRYVHPKGQAPWQKTPATQFSQASRPYQGNGNNWQNSHNQQSTYQSPKVTPETHLILSNGGSINRKFLDRHVTNWNGPLSTGTVSGSYGKTYTVVVPRELPPSVASWEEYWGTFHWVACVTRDPTALLPETEKNLPPSEPIKLTERQKQRNEINAAYRQAEIDWNDEDWWERHGASPVTNMPSKQTPLVLSDPADVKGIKLIEELKGWGIDTDDDLMKYARELLGALDDNLRQFGYELTDWEINDIRGE